MSKLLSLAELFKGRHFDAEIIALCVRWDLGYKLSYRDLAEMMAERGVSVAPSTILRWVQHYAPEFEKRWNRFVRPVRGLAHDVARLRRMMMDCWARLRPQVHGFPSQRLRLWTT